MREAEKMNRRTGLFASAGFHAALILALFFIVAWRAPDPPLPEYGIELNFGLDDQGSGNVQPDKTVGDQGNDATTETNQQESVSEVKENTDAESKELVPEKAVDQAVSKIESAVAAEEEQKKVVSPPDKKVSESTVKKVIAAEYKKDVPKEVMPAESQKSGEQGSQGDDAKKIGDKGSAEGKLNAEALYGTPGGGGGGTGMNLQMSGWAWAEQPSKPELPDNENGRVEFEITCDENGDIMGIRTVERSLSPRAEQLLKDVIRKNSLIRTSTGKVPKESTGKIIFVLKTK